jgi:hypothetical protein
MRGKGIRAVKLLIYGLLTVILLGGAGFMIWASMPSQPMPEASGGFGCRRPGECGRSDLVGVQAG